MLKTFSKRTVSSPSKDLAEQNASEDMAGVLRIRRENAEAVGFLEAGPKTEKRATRHKENFEIEEANRVTTMRHSDLDSRIEAI